MVDDLTLGKVRLTVVEPDGTRREFGRNINVGIREGTASARRRALNVIDPAEAVSVLRTGRRLSYEITMSDGTKWLTQGCGCGGGD